MTTGGPVRSLIVDADLDIEIDAADGVHATGRLTNDGRQLRLVLDRPEALAGSADRTMISVLAEQLAGAGVHAELHGPDGRIAAVDPARASRVSALLTGSPYVAIDRAGWALATRTAGPAVLRWGAVVIGVLAAAAVAGRARRT